MKKNLVILNIALGVCNIYPVDEVEDYEKFITEKLGINIEDCCWMVIDDIKYKFDEN